MAEKLVPLNAIHEAMGGVMVPFGGWIKSTNDIAKRMADFGVHPPTVYFPLIVHEAMMVEPTESESKESLDHLVELMSHIADEAVENPDLLKSAPHVPNTPVGRLDETKAARKPILTHQAYVQSLETTTA